MKFTLSWLNDHLNTDLSLKAITDKLTMLGFEVEKVQAPSKVFSTFFVAQVVEVMPDPTVDQLNICKVDIGKTVLQVTSHAKNTRIGMKSIFAPAGTYVPSYDFRLKQYKNYNEIHNGMLMSEGHLGMSNNHDNIIDLPKDAPIGIDYATYAGLDEVIIEISVTPNRGDCLSVRGIARDLAASGIGTLKPLDTSPMNGTFISPLRFEIDLPLKQTYVCPVVIGRYFRNVKNGPSPFWMQKRLRAVDISPISALVDITNYFMLDLGCPIHAYDAAKLHGNPSIRLAKNGEKCLGINDKEYTLETDMLVISDAKGIEGIAGIMGGKRTSVNDNTTCMFLEAAIFNAFSIASTGRKLGILSESRYRFERGLDYTSPWWGVEIVARMILKICGGEASDIVVNGKENLCQRKITLRYSRIAALCGVDVPNKKTDSILSALGFEVNSLGESISVIPPPWRSDVMGEAELVEEIVRVFGYDKIPPVSMEHINVINQPALTFEQNFRRIVKRSLVSRGMMEAVTFSFLPLKHAELFGGGKQALQIVNPISSDLAAMRPSILPNLITAATRNINSGHPDIAMFEVGPKYIGDQPEDQCQEAVGLRVGRTGRRDWRNFDRAVDVFDAKADVINLLEMIEISIINLHLSQETPSWYHPGRSGCFYLGSKIMAYFGDLHPYILKYFNLNGPAVAFEVLLDNLPIPKHNNPQRPLLENNTFQSIVRDFAFIVAEDLPADRITQAVGSADKAIINSVHIFDQYTGPNLPQGTKSIAVEVTMQPRYGNMKNEQIEAISAKIIASVKKNTNGILRD
ncbi:phenylalanyl-tRNA synthetase, beta subunit [Candidatus Endolissoclinum faulkneri L2]|uniref:Phenylalanine--tRNA ligase beta subunit n=1 Tax=Candidatus Endolissoclinum faulkneri L2 TaxID=1193729 RepID=K7YI94_9PROT|nr:phenylalanine--tRNA ligase subunit beta [Candidatus Endolissoclinum faulkneri]AFX99325.1 phenylalanyl-tRNA synthetase, beta subunit [Candidatus Endolissoclinum faulkneri L2]